MLRSSALFGCLIANSLYCGVMFLSEKHGAVYADLRFALRALIYLSLFYAAVSIGTRWYCRLPSRAGELPFEASSVGSVPLSPQYSLGWLFLMMTGVAVAVGLDLRASQVYGSLLLTLTVLHLLATTHWLQLRRAVVRRRLSRLFWFHPSLNLVLALVGGLLAIAISDAVDGAMGQAWLFQRLHGERFPRGWPPALLLLCGGYLTFARHPHSILSDRAGWYRSILIRLANLALVQALLVAVASWQYDLSSLAAWNIASRQSGLAIAAGLPLAVGLTTVRLAILEHPHRGSEGEAQP